MNLAAVIEKLSSPLEPISTGVEPRVSSLPDLQAVIFDVYGTLLISGCGDIGNSADTGRADAFAAALSAANVQSELPLEMGVERLHSAIASQQEELKRNGVRFPEVDIVQAWKTALADDGLSEQDLKLIAVEYECRVNPIWPMPQAIDLVQAIGASDLKMGIISNAQFFTPIAVKQLFGADLASLGFDPGMRFYSYEHNQAKPGTVLYEMAAHQLRTMGIDPKNTLYVGNDMLNDIMPANIVGFHTALFAGDKRSLRLRDGDSRVQHREPDWVVTDFAQMIDALGF